MLRKFRFIVLSGVVLMTILGAPVASHAILAPDQPIVTFPVNAGGYNATSITVTGFLPSIVGPDLGAFVRVNGGINPSGCPTSPGCPLMGGPTMVNPDGTFAIPISVTDGHFRIFVTASNGFGDGPSAVRDFLIDTVPPAAPTVDPVITTPGSKAANITGTGEPQDEVVATDEAGLIRRSTVNLDGTFTILGLWTPGPHTVSVTQFDLAFNASPPSAPVSFVITYDVSVPSAPVILTPAENGVTASDVTISGSATPNTTVSVLEDTPQGFIYYSRSIAVDGAGNWSFETFLLDGTHFIQAVDTSATGITGPRSPVRTFTVDSTPPKVTLALQPDFLLVGLYLNGDGFHGTVSDNVGIGQVEVKVLDGSNVVVDDIATCTCSATSGTWSDNPANISTGLYTVEVTATDEVGNVSKAATEMILVLI